MKNLCLAIIFLTVVPMVWFSSCAKVESDDTQNPVVSEVRFNTDDTIMWKGDTIRINSSKNTSENRIDTLVIGKIIYMTARFTDNVALSGYIVRMDSVQPSIQKKDSAFIFKTTGLNIFRKTDTIIKLNKLIQIPDTLSGRNAKVRKPVRQGDDYKMWVVVGDMANNRDSISPRVKLLTRDSIYQIRKKK